MTEAKKSAPANGAQAQPAAAPEAAATTAASGTAAGAAAAQTKIVWDDSRMSTSYANVCNVLGTREEITLLFGANQSWHSAQREVKVVLSDRIVLNPYAAKRLQIMLSKGLDEYESRYGALKLEP